MRATVVTLLCTYFGGLNGIPVDNSVEGDPEIECGASKVTVNFNTRNSFEGHVYVKGLYDQSDCRNDENGRQVAGIELSFEKCNMARTRSLNPKGIFVTSTIVISFHPQFVTKVDRAYRIECFYMESDKSVSSDIEVADLTTLFQTQTLPMPICTYEILEGGPSGNPVDFAIIGQQVYHNWKCESETPDLFCAVVHSCTVDDGHGEQVEILDENGCAVDRFVLNNLEYPTDLQAGQEAHVYKYADRSQLFYHCQIAILVKEPDEECVRPECPEPRGYGARTSKVGAEKNESSTEETRTTTRPSRPRGFRASASQRLLRRKRNLTTQHWQQNIDVRAEHSTLDITTSQEELDSLFHGSSKSLLLPSAISSSPSATSLLCLTPWSLSLLFVFLASSLAASICIATCFVRRSNSSYY